MGPSDSALESDTDDRMTVIDTTMRSSPLQEFYLHLREMHSKGQFPWVTDSVAHSPVNTGLYSTKEVSQLEHPNISARSEEWSGKIPQTVSSFINNPIQRSLAFSGRLESTGCHSRIERGFPGTLGIET